MRRLKARAGAADTSAVSDERTCLSYLNTPERRALGLVVSRLCRTSNPRFQRALEANGAEATARMACVNALRIYAIVLFALGATGRLLAVAALADACFALALVCMAWSFWCLYTVLGPEREHRRRHAGGAQLG